MDGAGQRRFYPEKHPSEEFMICAIKAGSVAIGDWELHSLEGRFISHVRFWFGTYSA